MAQQTRLGASGFSRPVYGSFAGKVEPANPPDDDDADVTITTRIDLDGATVRPARLTALFSADRHRNAALSGASRIAAADMSRHRARWDRSGSSARPGRAVRVLVHAGRAADLFAVRALRLRWSPSPGEPVRAVANTSRTDPAGATIRPALLTLLASVDEGRNAGLSGSSTIPAARHDAVGARWQLQQAGHLHRVLLIAPRAGDIWAPRAIRLTWAPSGSVDVRAASL